MIKIIMRDHARVMRELDEKREIKDVMIKYGTGFCIFLLITIGYGMMASKESIADSKTVVKTTEITKKKDYLVSPEMAEYMSGQGSGLIHRDWDMD